MLPYFIISLIHTVHTKLVNKLRPFYLGFTRIIIFMVPLFNSGFYSLWIHSGLLNTLNFILEKQQINFTLYMLSFLLFCTFAWRLLEKSLGVPLHFLIKIFEIF